eukprot:TRINITY_DN6832_c0_g1_i6.p1 TRINITY_DN6832_c0_g1~~TRINITY_DN6832_c0_g1_i6.p1  ORF type:complete len:434 (+),score=88.18 TRINITY_DN6832_c0_g1_i6:1095-2396(+)
MDVNTSPPTYHHLFPDLDAEKIPAIEGHVYADSMAFGMGQCCLQTTYQMESLEEAFYIYDQLLPFTPIMLALTASTPILRGYLTDTDTRWSILAQSVDDRTLAELGKRNPQNCTTKDNHKDRNDDAARKGIEDADRKENEDGLQVQDTCHEIPKSRYDSVSSFLSPVHSYEYNDIPLVVDPASLEVLLQAGIPKPLAQHVAHLFIRDPLVVYNGHIEIDDMMHSDHFENIQSTNWQSLRFKPPLLGVTNMGFRVEFRTMELQFTDFENAAYACFVSLLVETIRYFKPFFYIPISKIDENMKFAHCRESVTSQKFWFREDVQTNSTCNFYRQMTIDEIMNGSSGTENRFCGIIPLIRRFVEKKNEEVPLNPETLKYLNTCLTFIGQRASGMFCSVVALTKYGRSPWNKCHVDKKVCHVSFRLQEGLEGLSFHNL